MECYDGEEPQATSRRCRRECAVAGERERRETYMCPPDRDVTSRRRLSVLVSTQRALRRAAFREVRAAPGEGPGLKVAMGDTATEAEEKAERQVALVIAFSAVLAEKKNGAKLPPDLIKSVATNLALAGIEEEDVEWEDYEILLQAAKEGWSNLFVDDEGESPDWPTINEMLLKRWTGHAAAAKKVVVESGPLGGGPAISSLSIKVDKDDAARKELVEEHGLSGAGLRKGIEACSNQGLTPGAACALMLSLYVGRTVDQSEVKMDGFKFGTDPKTSDLVTKVLKATKGSSTPKTLPKLWEKEDFEEMQTWFNDLVRDFTDDGYITESSLVAQFWSRTVGILGSDGKKVGKYLCKFYDKVHTGRGIPVPLDHDIMAMLNAQPVHWESRRFLVMRHPSTGRLMWCDRLPFGFLDSPRSFCHVSEAVAQLFRRRMDPTKGARQCG